MSSPEPKVLKYWTLVEHLREQISNGRLQTGSRVPSLAEMQAVFGVSRATVEKAYTLLEQEGLLQREQGRGTFVAEQKSTVRAIKRLGLVTHTWDPTGLYVTELLTGVREEAFRHGLEILWFNKEEVIGDKQVDAVLMYCHPTEALAFNLPRHLPQVLLFHNAPDFTCVTPDDYNGVRLATQYLLEQGHRRIAYLALEGPYSQAKERLAGYRAACAEAGLPHDERFVKYLIDRRRHGFGKSGELTMRNWLEEGWRELECTALLAYNDHVAMGAIRVLGEHGIRVPDDVSVIGYDGTELSELCIPKLTTIYMPLRELGVAAVEALVTQMKNGVPPETQKIVLPVQLKMGESTAVNR